MSNKRSAEANPLKGEGRVESRPKSVKRDVNEICQMTSSSTVFSLSPLESFFIQSEKETETIERAIKRQLEAGVHPTRPDSCSHHPEIPAAPFICTFLNMRAIMTLSGLNKYFRHQTVHYILPRFTIQMIYNRTTSSERQEYAALLAGNVEEDTTKATLPDDLPTKLNSVSDFSKFQTSENCKKGK